jgi:hypothetical protein
MLLATKKIPKWPGGIEWVCDQARGAIGLRGLRRHSAAAKIAFRRLWEPTSLPRLKPAHQLKIARENFFG